MGGDEFTILLESNITHTSLTLVVERILTTLATPFELSGNQTVHLSGSIGVAIAPDNADDIKQLYKIADAAMYKAKELGKNRFVMGQS
jgi:diguanylate cyclase (GGDEF)-like protein